MPLSYKRAVGGSSPLAPTLDKRWRRPGLVTVSGVFRTGWQQPFQAERVQRLPFVVEGGVRVARYASMLSGPMVLRSTWEAR